MISQTGHRDWLGAWVSDPETHNLATVAAAIRSATATLPAFAVENAQELLATLQICAFLRTAIAGANNDFDIVAVTPGAGGLSITFAIVVAGNNTPLTVGVVGSAITVNAATGPAGAVTSTAAQVIAAVQASAAASALVTIANAPANDGTGVVAALGATNLGNVSGTAPTIDAKLQTTIDPAGATGFYDVPSASFTQANAVGSEGKVFKAVGLYARWVITLGGTTPIAAVGFAVSFRRH